MNEINGKEYPLNKIFSSDFQYHIPGYQRPYAWTETEAGALFDDLYEFYQGENKDENFFLGSIVLIKANNNPYAEVIDGQQRLTTLSILFSVIASNLTGSKRVACIKRLRDEGDELSGIESQPRLFLREHDQDFFHKYIQIVNLEKLKEQDLASIDIESQKHIKLNCELLLYKVNESFEGDEEEITTFCKFLLNRCYLVVVSTPSQESAFRIFSVMNSRGLDLLPTDIIKSETIGKLPPNKQELYTDKWESLENKAGRDGFNEVFTHLRTIFVLDKAKKSLLEEFRSYVMKEVLTPESLIDDYIEPYTEIYLKLKNCKYESTQHADEINEILYWLNRIGNYDWMPSAMLFFNQHINDSEYILWFIRKLERLASYLQVTAQDVTRRMVRYKHLLAEMKETQVSDIHNPLKNIELTEWEKRNFLNTLNGDIYTMPSLRRNYIIQRLDSFVSTGGATYNMSVFTIEHVLPQNPSRDSEWLTTWTDDTRSQWLNKIANLVPLTRQKNSAAQNYDFADKKTKYFQTKGGTSSFPLTTQVINEDKWTPSVVSERQKMLLSVFQLKWELNEDNTRNNDDEFLLSGRGGIAKGKTLNGGNFEVLAGSKISKNTTTSLLSNYVDLRKKLLEEGVVIDEVFVNNYVFESPSAASSVILGRTSNGQKDWKTLDGRTLGKYAQ